jgi:hypothetical protein
MTTDLERLHLQAIAEDISRAHVEALRSRPVDVAHDEALAADKAWHWTPPPLRGVRSDPDHCWGIECRHKPTHVWHRTERERRNMARGKWKAGDLLPSLYLCGEHHQQHANLDARFGIADRYVEVGSALEAERLAHLNDPPAPPVKLVRPPKATRVPVHGFCLGTGLTARQLAARKAVETRRARLAGAA